MAVQTVACTSGCEAIHGDQSIRIDVVSSFEAAEAIAKEWNALIVRINDSLYMTFDWCRIWWQHYGRKRKLRLFVIRRGNEIVGIAPMFVDRIGIRGFRARVAKIVGCDSTLALVNLPIEPMHAGETFASIARQLIERDRCDMICLGPISQQSPQLDGIRKAISTTSDCAIVFRDRECGSHTVFEMPDGFETYLKSLSKNQRSNYKRNVNKLHGSFNFRVDVLRSWAEVGPEFEKFVEMHQAQWKAENKLGHFGDWPDSLRFTRDLVQHLSAGAQPTKVGGVRLIRFLADDAVVSYYFCFEHNGTFYWRLPARRVGPEWDAYALGRVGLLKMIEVAAAEGATSIEAGTGAYEYKERLNAKSVPLASLVMVANRLGGRIRARAALAFADLLHFAYYRIWFSRLAPSLGIPLRPLWRTWIRSRF